MRTKATADSKSTVPPSKTSVYTALSDLNRNFEHVLLDLDRLKTRGTFPGRFEQGSLASCQAAIEETRAWINLLATEALHERAERDRAHFGRIRLRFETKYEDPQDVLLRAERLRKRSTSSAARKRGSPG